MIPITMTEQITHNASDEEPVVYCAECYSLKIVHEDAIDSDCCADCGCTTVQEAPFEVWENLYEQRYGKKFAEKSNDPRKSPIFKLSFSKLIEKVSNNPKWESIIKGIYGFIPKGLNKADTIIIFFDKLVRDNKVDALRELLYKMKL